MDTGEIAKTNKSQNRPLTVRLIEGWEAFTASPMRVFLLALAFALLFCGITELTWVKNDLNDDYTIASVLSGRLMGEQGLCLFLNALLCTIIYNLNTLYPHFNWFAVLELVTVFVSFTIICYLVIRHAPVYMALLGVSVVAYYTLPGCFTINNFTYVAFISSCAGCMLLARSLCLERHKAVNVVGGLVLLTIGSLWRNIMAWLCVPIFGIAAIAIVVRHCKDGAPVAKSILRIWPFILAVILGFGLTVYDLAVWKASPWDEWRTFNDERSMLSDFPHYPYEEVEDQLKELGVSKNDYELLFSWTTEDPDFFTTEKIQSITDIALIDWISDKTPASVVKNYAKSVLGDPEVAILLLCTLIAGLLFTRGRCRIWAIAVIAIALAMSLFFSAMGRLPERVHYPIWVYAFCAICMMRPVFGDDAVRAFERPKGLHAKDSVIGRIALPFAIVACFVALATPVVTTGLLTVKCVNNFAPQRIAVTFDADNFDIGGKFTEYIHEHPGNVYVLHNSGHRQLRMEHYLKAYYDDQLQFQVVSLGGWLSRSPYNNTKNSSLNMANPIKGLIDNKNALLVVSSKEHAERIERYLQEHYYPDAHAELVDKLDKSKGFRTKLLVYQYTAS